MRYDESCTETIRQLLSAVLATVDGHRLEPGTAPLLYELETDSVVIHSDVAIPFGPPLGDWSPATSWRVRSAALSTGSQPTNSQSRSSQLGPDHVLVRASLERELFVDLSVARLITVVGPTRSLGALVAAIAADAASGALSAPARVVRMVSTAPAVGLKGIDVLGLAEIAVLAEAGARILVFALSPSVEELEALVESVGPSGSVSIVTDRPHRDSRLLLLAEPGYDSAFLRPSSVGSRSGGGPTDRRLEVLVLGPIEIRGAAAGLGRRPLLTELITYFAVHPAGSPSRAWTAALWPDRRVPAQTVANRLSEARRVLGFAPDNLPRLRRDGDRHLLVDVSTDWERFCELTSPTSTQANWREALELVRGRPFENLHEGQWTILEGLEAEITERISNSALGLGTAALADGDPETAIWAAQRGLRAVPFDERLHRLLMRAADLAGNRTGVDEVLRQLALMLEVDGDPLLAVHPETAALYTSLTVAH